MSQWRLSDWALGLLAALIVLAAWESLAVNNQPETHGCGGDFPQYYVAGTILRGGDASRLYDQAYFRDFQKTLRDDPLPSLYPPSLGLLVMPLSYLSYSKALAVWWAIQAMCLMASGAIFYRSVSFEQAWRINMLMALAAMAPLWLAIGIGQVGPMILLIVAGGLTLHKRDRCVAAGLLLSLLALKPQLAAGLVLWMLLRRDIRTLLGLAAGLAIQVIVVAAIFGPGLWFDYVHAMPTIAAMTRRAHFSPMMEASFVGTASNLYWSAGLVSWEKVSMKFAYALSVSVAAVMLCRIVFARRPLLAAQQSTAAPETANYEYACGVMFMTIFPPYFILYDHMLMAIPLVMLWSSPAWRWGMVLFASTTVLVVNLSLVLGFSLSGITVLITMCYLMHSVVQAEGLLKFCPNKISKNLSPILTS
jgi:hypothetical protein